MVTMKELALDIYPYNVYTSPNETILCVDSFQSMYSQMLCGIIYRQEVLRCGAVFASGLVLAIKFLTLHWKQLAHDIETGTLNPKITDPNIRACMSKILKPDRELAQFVTGQCFEGNWEGIITRGWMHFSIEREEKWWKECLIRTSVIGIES
ncbi:auxin-responsive GH3 family protein [Artemisia annua]|uniref:Auxin-responsive GH3 family protein n=1 Tax=Artemisia annua TaxID=35608 RepID=A0A2U1KMU8_ARTAN|nr:auxin-responsive GH3 family protein [Artemisia annua]